jgi:hypothetical protein
MGQPMKVYLPKKTNKMNHQFGSIKYRNKPSTTVLNLSLDAPIPVPHEKGECWNMVLSDQTIDWVTAFKDLDNNIETVCFSKKQLPGKPLPCLKKSLD